MYDAVVLAGGSGRRLGGIDKGSLEVGGLPLLDRVLNAVATADRRFVVGPARRLPSGVVGTSEHPPGSGPVAGLAAGLELVTAPLVAVLACDLPFVTGATIQRLINAMASDGRGWSDGAQLVDNAGRRQPLTAVYRTGRLRASLAALGDLTNAPMRAVLERMFMLDLETDSPEAWDCDTWSDVSSARDHAEAYPLEEV